jgi:hypothetical protein
MGTEQDIVTIELFEPVDYTQLDGKIRLKEVFIKAGDVWEFHKYDKDPFPSSPHGHCAEKSQKLDIYTGIIYDINTRNPIRKVSQKKLLEIKQRLMEKGFSLKP